ncbi:MAG: MFS transporter [Burkholderiales bacterium]
MPLLVPQGVHPNARVLVASRAARAFGDGFVSLLLPYYLTRLGYSAFEIGVIITATLLGSGLMTLATGFLAHRIAADRLLRWACVLMIASGFGVIATTAFWPLLIVALVGTLNPSAGDVSVFYPLEQTLLARAAPPAQRTALFARYSLVGALVGAAGAQAAAVPEWLAGQSALPIMTAIQAMFVLYALLGALTLFLYRGLRMPADTTATTPTPLGPSRRVVYKLAALFSLDAFAGGFAVQSLLALWLFQRFELSVATTGSIFLVAGVLAAFSFPVAAWLARRIGLVNTMVFTHLPANVFLILVPFMPTLGWALFFLLLRFALSSMDVPARSSYVMAVVTPPERPAAASLTAVPRSLASAVSPLFAGALLSASPFGWPLVLCGALKIAYDVALLYQFRHVRPPEESAARVEA